MNMHDFYLLLSISMLLMRLLISSSACRTFSNISILSASWAFCCWLTPCSRRSCSYIKPKLISNFKYTKEVPVLDLNLEGTLTFWLTPFFLFLLESSTLVWKEKTFLHAWALRSYVCCNVFKYFRGIIDRTLSKEVNLVANSDNARSSSVAFK